MTDKLDGVGEMLEEELEKLGGGREWGRKMGEGTCVMMLWLV